jgi:hypothetical protein
MGDSPPPAVLGGMRASPLAAFVAPAAHRLALRSGTASRSGHAHHLAGLVESWRQRRHPDHGDSEGEGSDADDAGEDLAVHPEFLGQHDRRQHAGLP